MSQITDTRLRCAALAAFASCATVMPGTAAPEHGDAAVRHEIVQAAERGQSIEPAKTPDGVATLKVAWKNTAGGAGSFKRMPVKPLPLDWSVPVVCRLYLPAGSGLRAFNLRIEDRHHEHRGCGESSRKLGRERRPVHGLAIVGLRRGL